MLCVARCLLLDHLVGRGQQRFRDSEAERLGGFEVDGKFELGRLDDRQVGRLLALEDAASIKPNLTGTAAPIASIAQKPPGRGGCSGGKHGRYRIASRERNDLMACDYKKGVGADQEGADLLLDKGRKSRRNIAFAPAIEDQHAHPENMGRRLQIFRLGLDSTGIAGIDQHCNRCDRRHHFVQQRKALWGDLGTDAGDAGEIAGGTIEARYEAECDGVGAYSKNDGDGLG